MIETTPTRDPEARRGSARTAVFMLVQTPHGPLWAFDVGLGGLRCFARSLYTVGQYLDVSFRLPGEDADHRVGAQVACLEPWPGGGVALRLRFCRPSKALELAIYRLLDRRRAMWDPKVIHEAPAPQNPYADRERPFEGLLLEAFAALRLREVNRPGFARRGPSRDLENLARILGRDGAAADQPNDPHDPPASLAA